jgi:hypothetical protein
MANRLLGYALTSDEVTPGWGWLMENTEVLMSDQPNYQWTVIDFTDRSQTKHFVQKTGKAGAVAYVNSLLRAGHKAKIYPYREPRRYVDIVAERGPNG